MGRRNLFLYLLLNVFISACVAGAILFWYDRNYRATIGPVPQAAAPAREEKTVAPLETLPPDADVPVEIEAADRLADQDAPLAARMRPRTLEEFVGQGHVLGPGSALGAFCRPLRWCSS